MTGWDILTNLQIIALVYLAFLIGDGIKSYFLFLDDCTVYNSKYFTKHFSGYLHVFTSTIWNSIQFSWYFSIQLESNRRSTFFFNYTQLAHHTHRKVNVSGRQIELAIRVCEMLGRRRFHGFLNRFMVTFIDN